MRRWRWARSLRGHGRAAARAGAGSAGAEGRGAAGRWLRARGGIGPLPAPRPPSAAAPHTSGRAPGSARPAQPPLPRGGSAGRRRQPQPRGAPAGQRGRAPPASHLVPHRRKGRPAAPATESSHRGSGSCIPAGRCCCGRRPARPPAPAEPPSAQPRTGTGGSFWGSSVFLTLFPRGSIAARQRSQPRLRGAGGEGVLQSGSAGTKSLPSLQ